MSPARVARMNDMKSGDGLLRARAQYGAVNDGLRSLTHPTIRAVETIALLRRMGGAQAIPIDQHRGVAVPVALNQHRKRWVTFRNPSYRLRGREHRGVAKPVTINQHRKRWVTFLNPSYGCAQATPKQPEDA